MTLALPSPKQMVPCGFDWRVSLLTLSLHSVANANRDERMGHIFGLVSGPADADAATGVSVIECRHLVDGNIGRQLVEEAYTDDRGNRGILTDGNYGKQIGRHCYS